MSGSKYSRLYEMLHENDRKIFVKPTSRSIISSFISFSKRAINRLEA